METSYIKDRSQIDAKITYLKQYRSRTCGMQEAEMYRILIVEDDRGIAEAIKEKAKMWELQARCVQNFRNVLADFSEYNPHLVLLDIALPFFNGYHWYGEIRKVSKVPIIFISSASDNMNIVMAMNMGADDFIAKPFDRSVLMAKIQAMLRRTYDFASAVPVLEHRGRCLTPEITPLSGRINGDISGNFQPGG